MTRQQCNYVYPRYVDRTETGSPIGCSGCQNDKDHGPEVPHQFYGEKEGYLGSGFVSNQSKWIPYEEYFWL